MKAKLENLSIIDSSKLDDLKQSMRDSDNLRMKGFLPPKYALQIALITEIQLSLTPASKLASLAFDEGFDAGITASYMANDSGEILALVKESDKKEFLNEEIEL